MYKLKKAFGEYKVGKTYDSFGGLVRGLSTETNKINFSDKEWFELVTI